MSRKNTKPKIDAADESEPVKNVPVVLKPEKPSVEIVDAPIKPKRDRTKFTPQKLDEMHAQKAKVMAEALAKKRELEKIKKQQLEEKKSELRKLQDTIEDMNLDDSEIEDDTSEMGSDDEEIVVYNSVEEKPKKQKAPKPQPSEPVDIPPAKLKAVKQLAVSEEDKAQRAKLEAIREREAFIANINKHRY